ncbi:MAG: undecaprenyl-diphosphate phosphatase, partial [Gammaproteobacteria bacterium]|nr:undecaprenyl-diphosphate phosphatase [Gammaproteobacteria bacterium]
MDFFQLFILSIIQGLTEFLPISSSAHLILVPKLTGWPDQGLAFDVAVHVGTLSAVVFYFRKKLIKMTKDWFKSVITFELTPDSRLAWGVIIGTIPVGIVGLLFKDFIETSLRSPIVIATTTIIFGLTLWWADAYGKRQRDEHTLTLKDILLIGCAQALALIPGTSRSGITMTAGLILGLSRAGAARFSFLLSIPAILLPGLLKTLDMANSPQNSIEWNTLFLGALISGCTAFLVIHFFLKLLEKTGMMPYVIYRLLLGG